MITEKKKILLWQIVTFITMIVFIIIPIVVPSIHKEVNLLDHKGELVSYNQAADLTTCEITLTFNNKVESGTAVIVFYDENENVLEEREVEFEFVYYNYKSPRRDRILTSSNINVSGKVKSYEVKSYDNIPAKNWNKYLIPIFSLLAVFMFGYFLLALRNKCKEFTLNNTNIIVYACFSEHYVKVNGNKVVVDKWLSLKPLELTFTLEDGTNAKVVYDILNRISLYINDNLYEETK